MLAVIWARTSVSCAELERQAEHLEQAFGDELRAGVELAALDQDDELVAAEAPDRVGVAHAELEPLADRLQQRVAGRVAEACR